MVLKRQTIFGWRNVSERGRTILAEAEMIGNVSEVWEMSEAAKL